MILACLWHGCPPAAVWTARWAVSAAAERACGEPVKDSKKSRNARHRGTPTCRGDPATSLRQRLARCSCRMEGAKAPGLEAQTMTALLAWSVSGPPGTAAGGKETSTPRPRGVPHGRLAGRLLFLFAAVMTSGGLGKAGNDRLRCRPRMRGRSRKHQP